MNQWLGLYNEPVPSKPALPGKFPGIVTAVDATTLKVKVKVPLLFGNQELPAPAWPCLPPAAYTDNNGAQRRVQYLPPEVGAGVWVEFIAGDPDQPIWTGTYEVS